MLYECKRIENVWNNISKIISMKVLWKHIVCGLPYYDQTEKITAYNLIISIVAYAIFKENSRCKFENTDYNRINVIRKIKDNISYYLNYNNILEGKKICLQYMQKIIDYVDW